MATEEERLELLSTVEDEFTEPLERLEQSLESVDDEIRQTGRGRDYVRIDVEVSGVSRAMAELEGLDSVLDDVNENLGDLDNLSDIDDIDVNVGGGGGDTDVMASGGGDSTPAMTSGGTAGGLFGPEEAGRFERIFGAQFDKDEFVRRGGQVARPLDLTRSDTSELIDSDVLLEGLTDSESDINVETIRSLDSPSSMAEFENALEVLRSNDATRLGDNGLAHRARQVGRRFKNLHFTMGTFHQLFAAMMPLLGIFVGALPAAIVGVGALATAALGAAGALAGIVGLGAMGIMMQGEGGMSMEPLREQLSDLKDSFVDAFAPLAQQFAPLVEEAIDEIDNMMGPLATASTHLQLFRGEFRGLVNFIHDAVPSFVADLLRFTNTVRPLLVSVGSFLANIDFLRFFAAELSRAITPLANMAAAISEMIPGIVRASQGFLAFAAGITMAVLAVSKLLNLLPISAEAIGGMISAMLLLGTATSLYTIAANSALTATLGLATGLLADAVGALLTYIPALSTATAATWGYYIAAAAVLGLLTLGLVPAVSSLASSFSILGGEIGQARKELEKFGMAQGNLDGDLGVMGNGGSNPYSTATGGSYVDNSTTVIESGDRDAAARQQYSSQYEHQQHVDSVFGG